MKTMIKVSAIVMVMLASYVGYAGPNNLVSMSVTGNKSFRLVLQDNASDLYITLKDQYGQTLYEEHVAGPVEYDKIFNVSSLPTGKYSLEMDYPTKYQVYPVEIKSNQVYLDNSQLEEYFKPIVRQKGTKVSISYFNTQNRPLRILVYDRDTNELLSQENLKDELVLGKQYDFSEAAPGNYLISMACNDRRYSHMVIIDK